MAERNRTLESAIGGIMNGGASMCTSCGGALGQDCFNPQECMMKMADDAVQRATSRAMEGRDEGAKVAADNERLRRVLATIALGGRFWESKHLANAALGVLNTEQLHKLVGE